VLSRAELARRVQRVAHLRGSFRLRSGATSDRYFDKYRFESDPVLLREIARGLSALLPPDVDALAGLELGGIPLAVALSAETGLPARFVRKEAKTYGTCNLVEGGEIAGQRLAVIEDVVTSGGQVVGSARELRKLGAHVEHVLCAIDRESGGREALAAAGLALRALFTLGELEASAP
jgi:orotate phosphoribosyltransferase